MEAAASLNEIEWICGLLDDMILTRQEVARQQQAQQGVVMMDLDAVGL